MALANSVKLQLPGPDTDRHCGLQRICWPLVSKHHHVKDWAEQSLHSNKILLDGGFV